jgi:hypothetical protein
MLDAGGPHHDLMAKISRRLNLRKRIQQLVSLPEKLKLAPAGLTLTNMPAHSGCQSIISAALKILREQLSRSFALHN